MLQDSDFIFYLTDRPRSVHHFLFDDSVKKSYLPMLEVHLFQGHVDFIVNIKEAVGSFV